jgi:hypothetical protein
MGLRGISDPETTGSYLDVSDSNREFDRKVRTVLRGLTVFFRHVEFLNIFKYGLFSYQYFCHKLLRWLVPLFLIFTFMSNLFYSDNVTILFYSFHRAVVFTASLSWVGKVEDHPGKLQKSHIIFLRSTFPSS